MALKNPESWSVEQLVDFLQNRDLQMDEQDTYFDVAEEIALRVANLLACVRHQDTAPPQYHRGHLLYTDEIREVLADRDC